LHHFDPEPTVDTLSYFVTYMSHHIEPRSVHTYLTGIVSELEPYFPHVKENRMSRLVKRTLQGSMRRFSSSITQKEPLTKNHLLTVMGHTPRPISHDDLLFRAQLETGFFGLMRLGELVWPDKLALRDSRKLSMRHTVIILPDSYSFLLEHDKTDTRYEGNKVLVQRSHLEPDPHDSFVRYLTSRDGRFPLHPQLWLRRNGTTPSRAWFMRKLRTFFPKCIGGHSMRAGGTTSLAAAG
ncbi:hypothetical protein HYDPIDRAFT_61093, partial [Hydnomerulius pinastri MD-312]